MWRRMCLLIVVAGVCVRGKIDSEDDTGESGDREPDDLDDSSTEHIGAGITQIVRHPYAASLLQNNVYICSAVILNTYWLLTESKCFDPDVTSSYVTHSKNMRNFTIRAGSSYNNKGGALYKIKMMINNFDLHVSAMKLETAMDFNARVQSVRLPNTDEEVTLGYLASIVAWTPSGHIRLVNSPLIEASICTSYTKLLPGHYICAGAVQDPNSHFCRKDNGGAVVQNNTLIAISSFLQPCAVYSRTHAFPKVSSFARWLDSVIWDENNRPTTTSPTTTTRTTKAVANITNNVVDESQTTPTYDDRTQFMLTLPFDPVNVPLEPGKDNSVISRMSLYESYLQNLARRKTSTTAGPAIEKEKKNALDKAWMQNYRNAVMMNRVNRYDNYAFN